MIGGAQLPSEGFVIAIVAEDPVLADDGAATTRWLSHLLLAADGFVVRARTDADEVELRVLGDRVGELVEGKRTEISFQSASKDLYLSLVRRPPGEIAVAGHIVRDDRGLLSSFVTRTDLPSLRSFGAELREFPHG